MAVVEMIAMVVLAVLGGWAGRRVGKGRFWWVGFGAALGMIAVVIVGHRSVAAGFVWPVSWVVDARVEPGLMAVVIPLMFLTLMAKMVRGRRGAVGVVTAAMVVYYSVLPVAAPWWVRGTLAAGASKFDRKGVCLQTHAYTCGPAAAVTCLRSLGVQAEEGPLAVAAGCGPVVGTDERVLAATVVRMFGGEGVTARARYVGRLEELVLPAVANMNMPVIGGHFVAVLAVSEKEVVVGDPYSGWVRVPRGEFMGQWKGSAVEIGRR